MVIMISSSSSSSSVVVVVVIVVVVAAVVVVVVVAVVVVVVVLRGVQELRHICGLRHLLASALFEHDHMLSLWIVIISNIFINVICCYYCYHYCLLLEYLMVK